MLDTVSANGYDGFTELLNEGKGDLKMKLSSVLNKLAKMKVEVIQKSEFHYSFIINGYYLTFFVNDKCNVAHISLRCKNYGSPTICPSLKSALNMAMT